MEAENGKTETVNVKSEAVSVKTEAVNVKTEVVNVKTEAENVKTETEEAANVKMEAVQIKTEAENVPLKMEYEEEVTDTELDQNVTPAADNNDTENGGTGSEAPLPLRMNLRERSVAAFQSLKSKQVDGLGMF
jgi:hypothetical protein